MATPNQPPSDTWRIAASDAGKTLAAVVREHLSVPWRRAEDLIVTRRVRIGDAIVPDPVRRMVTGEVVTVSALAPKVTRGMLEPERVVHVDRDVIVVRKPAGLLTLPFEKEDRDTLVDRTRVWLRRREGKDVELGVVHRLDKDTSGLVVFTRSFAAKKALGRAFAEHAIERRYLAIVHGRARAGTIDNWLVADRGDGLRGSTKTPGPQAQRAITHIRVIEALEQATLVECTLETGRTHQIRIHLSEAGNPIVGETVYIREHRGKKIAAPRQMLHAYVLGFRPPLGAPEASLLRFEDPPPDDFNRVLESLRRPVSTLG